MKGATYQSAGVDIQKAEAFVSKVKTLASSTHGPQVLGGIGGFAACFSLENHRCREPLLVSCTDGVGTKILIAQALNQLENLGVDLVAMCVNDLITLGATPLFFLDYLATGTLSEEQGIRLIEGIVRGCRESDCALIGGETAEMPGLYQKGEFDLAGFSVGIVDRTEVIDGRFIRAGNKVIGLYSSGLHSNGFSLARKVLLGSSQEISESALQILREKRSDWDQQTLGDILLTPTRIYKKIIQKIIQSHRILGIAHITGGGLPGNVPRILPDNVCAKIVPSSWKPAKIFNLIQNQGQVATAELFQTFNMGIGMVLIVDEKDCESCLKKLIDENEPASLIGEITERRTGEEPFELVD